MTPRPPDPDSRAGVPTCQSPGYTSKPNRLAALALLAFAAAVATARPAAAASPDGLDSAAAAALLGAVRGPADPASPAGGSRAAVGGSVGGTVTALPLPFALCHLSLAVPAIDVEAGLLRSTWAHRTVQLYGSAGGFVSPRHGFAGGARVVAGAAWQATWPDTLVRLGAALAAGAAIGVDQGVVPLVPGELSVEVARGMGRAWWFVRLSAGAELAAAERWTARGTFAIGALLGR